jgi:hypothetical protein
VALRLTMNCAIFLAVAAALGAVQSPCAGGPPGRRADRDHVQRVLEAWAITRSRDLSR